MELDPGKMTAAEARQMVMVGQDGRLSGIGLDSIRGRQRSQEEMLANILKHGTRATMTREQMLDSVASQVASSLRLSGFEVKTEDIRRLIED